MIDTTTTTDGEHELPEAQLFLTKKGEHNFVELHEKSETQTIQPPNVIFTRQDMSKPKTEENSDE